MVTSELGGVPLYGTTPANRSFPKWMVPFGLLCIFLFSTTAGSVLSTEEEIRGYLALPDYVGLVPEYVKAAVLGNLPLGSSKNDVQRFLSLHRIGTGDGGSSCKARANQSELRCQLGVDHHAWELVRESYTVSFAFDPAGTLRDVTVHDEFSWL